MRLSKFFCKLHFEEATLLYNVKFEIYELNVGKLMPVLSDWLKFSD